MRDPNVQALLESQQTITTKSKQIKKALSASFELARALSLMKSSNGTAQVTDFEIQNNEL